MSTIEKLGISGLRSYTADRVEVIKFIKPLTLILGKNGSGKTAIIEALRFAVLGAMPPHSGQGRTFVNDPRLSGNTETRAAVKLKFRATSGQLISCIRTMGLSLGNKKEEVKKFEQFLKMKNTSNDIVAIEHSYSEMNVQVPALFGVSRAVLDNVILCHQEEAMWPFAESLALKKDFD